jgi:hypothetical protein
VICAASPVATFGASALQVHPVLDQCFRDVNQALGGQDSRSWKRDGPERAACLSLWLWLWLHGLIWCWYLDAHPAGRTWIPRPWYRAKATPSFLDVLAALRRTLWSQRITTMPGTAGENLQISQALLVDFRSFRRRRRACRVEPR